MAAVSQDPKLYGLAFQACQSMRQAPGYCAQISADQWAQRDPDNGTVWLYVADKANKPGNESAKAEAIYRFTRAKRFDLGLSLLSELVGSEALGSDTAFVTSTAIGWAFQANTTALLGGYQVMTAYCTTATVRDANRAQVCDDIANTLLRDESTVISPFIGFRIGERLAWPAGKLAALREELDALRAVQGETDKLLWGDAKLSANEDLTAQGQAGCEAMDRTAIFLQQQMRVGEVRELRDRLASHPLSRAALAARYAREHPQKR